MSNVKISTGNSKMGAIPSVSLPSHITCIRCACNEKCYAHKLEQLRPNVLQTYQTNLRILLEDPETFWREVEGAIMLNRFFRFHVSGDIVDEDYFRHMVEIASRQSHCEILCFTKKYAIVNRLLESGSTLPPNLHMFFSAWIDLPMVNPFSLPEAHVRYRDGTTTARADAALCSGNCAECAKTSGGCWTLQNGEQIVFNEH